MTSYALRGLCSIAFLAVAIFACSATAQIDRVTDIWRSDVKASGIDLGESRTAPVWCDYQSVLTWPHGLNSPAGHVMLNLRSQRSTIPAFGKLGRVVACSVLPLRIVELNSSSEELVGQLTLREYSSVPPIVTALTRHGFLVSTDRTLSNLFVIDLGDLRSARLARFDVSASREAVGSALVAPPDFTARSLTTMRFATMAPSGDAWFAVGMPSEAKGERRLDILAASSNAAGAWTATTHRLDVPGLSNSQRFAVHNVFAGEGTLLIEGAIDAGERGAIQCVRAIQNLSDCKLIVFPASVTGRIKMLAENVILLTNPWGDQCVSLIRLSVGGTSQAAPCFTKQPVNALGPIEDAAATLSPDGRFVALPARIYEDLSQEPRIVHTTWQAFDVELFLPRK